MIALGPRELAKALFATMLAMGALHIAERIIAGIVAAQYGLTS